MRQYFILLVLTISNLLNSQNQPSVFFAGGNICETTPFKLVFFDEFNGNSINTQKWTRFYPYGENGSDQCPFCRTHSTIEKPEGQIYRDGNVRVENGKLYLDVKEEAGTWYEFNEKYTSGMIQSIQSFNTYTKYEIRCKISSGVGYWPSFWTFGGDPATELDVFEFYEESDRFECSVHYYDNEHEQFHQIVEPGIDMSQEFHTYTVEYDKFFVNFYLDGVKKVTMNRYFKLDGTPVTNCNVPAGWYLQHPEFPKYGNPINVIANVALFDEEANNLQVVPKSMEIDFIRVYQRNTQNGLQDLCNSFKVNGSSALCFDRNKRDTLLYCFDGPIDNNSQFSTTSNLVITQNPAFDLIQKDTIIIVNGIPIDTFYFDTLKHFGCIRLTTEPNSNNEFGSVSITTNIEPCGLKTFTLPLQLGIPFPQINSGYIDPCRGEIALSTLQYNKETQVEWTIFSDGNLSASPTIYHTNQNEVNINLPNQRIFKNAHFYVKLKVKSDCGEREIVQKINLPDRDCKNIEYIISPNPSNGIVSIQLLESDMINDISKIYIRNSNTNDLVFVKENIILLDDLNFDLLQLQNGTYLISIENSEFQLFSKTFQILR
ncbi:MAG: glycoside hydrolase family 16 protein [Saprospiraceae bacterium]|nr:glycoside hydrolase family 16 protein [Saprospiraceae bacterium]